MSHDIEDLLDIIKALELRIIQLELDLSTRVTVNAEDSWYWAH